MSIKKMRRIIKDEKYTNHTQTYEDVMRDLGKAIQPLETIIKSEGLHEANEELIHKAQKLRADVLNAIGAEFNEDMSVGNGTVADLGTPPTYALGSVDARGGSKALDKENPFLKKKKRMKKEKSEMMHGGEPEISRVMRERQMTYEEAKEYLKIKFGKGHDSQADAENYDKINNECFGMVHDRTYVFGYDEPAIQREIKELKIKINSTSDEREKSELVSKLQDLLIRNKKRKEESVSEDFHDAEDMLPQGYESDYEEEPQEQMFQEQPQERFPEIITVEKLKSYSDGEGDVKFDYIENKSEVETYLEHVGVTDEEVMNRTPYVGTDDIDFIMAHLIDGEVKCIYVGNGVPALNKDVFKVYENQY